MGLISQVVVTGSSGFLGAHLVDYIRLKLPHVKLICVPGRSAGGPDLVVPGALRQFICNEDFDPQLNSAFIHAASEISFSHLGSNLNNVRQSLNCIEAISSMPFDRIGYVSSVSALQASEGYRNWSPHENFETAYGATKAISEMCFSHLLGSRSVVNFRLGGLVGVCETSDMFWNKLICYAVKRGSRLLSVNRLLSFRNYISVRDAARAIAESVMHSDIVGSHTLSSYETLSTGELLQVLRDASPSFDVHVSDDKGIDYRIYPASPAFSEHVSPLLPQVRELVEMHLESF